MKSFYSLARKRSTGTAVTIAVVALWLVWVGAASATDNTTRGCVHDTAVIVPYDNGSSRACVYILNVFRRDLPIFQVRAINEQALVDKVVIGQTKGQPTRFLQVAPLKTREDRVSQAGVLVFRAYDINKNPLDFNKLEMLEIRLDTITQTLKPPENSASKILFLDTPLEKKGLGDQVEVEILSGGRSQGRRYSWYRPMDGWVTNYSLIGLAFSWPTWKFQGNPEFSVVPAMIEYEYRRYAKDGSFYIFSGIGVGPNIVLSSSKNDGGGNSGGNGLNGLVAAALLNLNGFKIGLGTRWSWSESRFDPMITLSVTEVVARNLGITGKVPSTLWGKPE
jgi:hypothetical protein